MNRKFGIHESLRSAVSSLLIRSQCSSRLMWGRKDTLEVRRPATAVAGKTMRCPVIRTLGLVIDPFKRSYGIQRLPWQDIKEVRKKTSEVFTKTTEIDSSEYWLAIIIFETLLVRVVK